MTTSRFALQNGKVKLPPAAILVGGLGTRLRPAYSAGPKSMAPIGGRPFLDYLLAWLQREGVQEVVLCVGYKRSHIQRFVGSGRKWKLRVKYSVEKRLLGTGGALRRALKLMSADTLLVMNGDTFLDLRLSDLLEFHLSRSATATLAAANVTDTGRYGSLRINGQGRITNFVEKSASAQPLAAKPKHLINGGIYVFQKKLLNSLPVHRPISLEKEIFPSLIADKNIYGYVTSAFFLDIGLPQDLGRAQSELPKRICINNSR